MPVTLKQVMMKVKDGDGQYVGVDAIAQETTADQLAAITAEGTAQVGRVEDVGDDQVDRIDAKAAEVESSLPTVGEMEGMLAPAFSSSTAYKAGDYVIHADGNDVNHVYRFVADHAAGEWTGSDAVRVSIGEEASQLKGDFNTYTGISNIEFTSGYIANNINVGSTYSDYNVVSNSAFIHAMFDVSELPPRTTITINGKGWTTGRLWSFVDADGKQLSVSDATIDVNDLVLRVPTSAKWCIINMYKAHAGFTYIGKPEADKFAALDAKSNADDIIISERRTIVNYGYDTPYHLNRSTASGTNSFSIDRDRQVITIDGGTSNNAVMVKINDVVDRSSTSSIIRGWTATVLLKLGHKYKYTVRKLSGTASNIDETVFPWALSIYKSGTSSTVGVYEYLDEFTSNRYITGDGGLYNLVFYINAGSSFKNARFMCTLEDLTEGSLIDRKASVIYSEASGSIASFNDGADDMPVKSMFVDINPVQNGSGDPSPDNVRPIDGFTGCNIMNVSGNMYDSAGTEKKTGSIEIIDKYTIRSYATSAQTYASTSQQLASYNLIPGKTYRLAATLTAMTGDASPRITIRNSENAIQVAAAFVNVNDTKSFEFTYDPSVHNYISFFSTFDTAATASCTYSDISLVSIDTVSVQFPNSAGTVYGGTLDVVSGELKVDRFYISNASTGWSYSTSKAHMFVRSISSTNYTDAEPYCNMYKPSPAKSSVSYAYDNGDKTICMRSGTVDRIFIRDDDYSDAESFLAAIVNMQLAIQLKNPTVYQLTPTEVRTILGGNNISADTGDVAVEYPVDTKTYADKIRSESAPLTDFEELSEEVDNLDARKADKNGYYADLTAGSAEQLLATQAVTDQEPYKFRATGGSADVGDRAYLDKIVGGTVAWNQLLQNGNFESTSGWASATNNGPISLSAENNELTVTFTGESSSIVAVKHAAPVTLNHVYLFSYDAKSDTIESIRYLTPANNAVATPVNIGPTYTNIATVIKAVTEGEQIQPIRKNKSDPKPVGESVTIRNVVWFDLTHMFGYIVADRIYNLEQATAGAGVAWFRKLFPASYYPYNPGELVSVEGLQSRNTIGFNQWDEALLEVDKLVTSTGNLSTNADYITCGTIAKKIPVIPGQSYFVSVAGSASGKYAAFYDANGDFISGSRAYYGTSNNIIVPENGMYMLVSIAYADPYKNDVCIHLVNSGTRNGEYEPYEKHSHPLDSSLTLRGIPKLDAANKLYFDGDEYAPDGTVTRRCKVVDLGTLTWQRRTESGASVFSTSWLTDYKQGSGVKAFCDKYAYGGTVAGVAIVNEKSDKGCYLYQKTSADGGSLYIKDTAYTEISAFRESISGVYLVYELATPTTETAEPYQQTQVVDDWGTEEFVSGTIVPVGTVTRYPANLRDKLQHLPSLANADGTYVISQSGSGMALMPLTTPTELPAAPSENGTYKLRLTVANGTPTYTWEVDS